MPRKYDDRTIKLVWGLSGNQCAFPRCNEQCIESSTDCDDAAIQCEMAYIFAYGNHGPRANPEMLERSRNLHENLILLCPTHHNLVDKQLNTYTATNLLDWKFRREEKANRRKGQIVKESDLELEPAIFHSIPAVKRFFLRKEELEILNQWAQSNNPIILIQAIGGMGKGACPHQITKGLGRAVSV
ncbi:MAG: HNH endonuclease [Chloroflexota bacterium]